MLSPPLISLLSPNLEGNGDYLMHRVVKCGMQSPFGCWEHMHDSASDDDTQRTIVHLVGPTLDVNE